MGKPLKFDAEKRAAYLLALERSGEVVSASAAAGVSRQCIYDAMNRDPEFREECERALGRLAEKAMATAKMLAIDGVVEPIFDKDGNKIGEKRKYSERLLLRLLERHMPQWRPGIDQKVEGTMAHSHEHTIKPRDLPPRARSRVRELLAELGGDEDVSRN